MTKSKPKKEDPKHELIYKNEKWTYKTKLGIYRCVGCHMSRTHEENKQYQKHLGWYCPNCKLYSVIKIED